MTLRDHLLQICKSLMILGAIQYWAPSSVLADPLVKEWNSVRIPAMPELKRVTADPAVTALFMISMTRETCNPGQRPRCAATVPAIAGLLAHARDRHVLVIHSLTRGGSAADHLVKELAPHDGEPIIPAGPGPDKFIGSNLDEILKQHGIKTVIVVGTQAQTAVLHTGAGSAFRGYRVVVPIDGMSSDTAFPELYTAWHLATTSRIGEFVTLTTTDMIGFSGPQP
jgi:nicotinamidase-related amidase